MMSRKEFLQNYWSYYLMLERKFLATVSFVKIATENFNTFSDEYASLLQTIGAEMDSFFKVYCNFKGNDKNKNIANYATFVLNDYPDIKKQEIEVFDTDIVISPFKNWNRSEAKQSLSWWVAFDNMKHNRVDSQKGASLENVLNMLGALFLLEMKYLSKISAENNEPDIPNKESELFSLKCWEFKHVSARNINLKLV